MGQVVSKHLGAHHIAISLSGSIWKYLKSSLWLLKVAELFRINFQTILHFADVEIVSATCDPNWVRNSYILGICNL
jgi:hypothetical protein